MAHELRGAAAPDEPIFRPRWPVMQAAGRLCRGVARRRGGICGEMAAEACADATAPLLKLTFVPPPQVEIRMMGSS